MRNLLKKLRLQLWAILKYSFHVRIITVSLQDLVTNEIAYVGYNQITNFYVSAVWIEPVGIREKGQSWIPESGMFLKLQTVLHHQFRLSRLATVLGEEK